MPVQIFETASEEETIALGRRIAGTLPRKCVVLLIGNLGAGKTTIVKGIAEGLGATSADEVTSPTFTLVHEYSPGLLHLDLYRIETERQLATLGLEELLDREAVVLVEWGKRYRTAFSGHVIEIRLTPGPEESRRIEVIGL